MYQQRFVLIIMLFFGFANEYMSRNILSIAITEIAQKTINNDSSTIIGERCPPLNDAGNATEDEFLHGGEYDWSEKLQGIILSSFYWGYIITHIPGGVLVEKFGGKSTFLVGMLITSILTLLTPFSIKLDAVNAVYLIILRVVLGLSQGFIYASVHGLMAAWIPLKERTRAAAVIFTGIQV